MNLSLHHPGTVAEAVALAHSLGEGARFLAGGTDLIVQMNQKRAAPEHLIDLGLLKDLACIEERSDAITLGALSTHKAIERHQAFQGALLALAEAARVVGGHQIRNRGTVGGNIMNASPAADVVVPLLALDAELTLHRVDNTRAVKLEDFLVRCGQAARQEAELLTFIRFAKQPAATATSFLKAGRRRAMEISIVCVSARLTLDAVSGVCRDARIALGAVGASALRAHPAEQLLEGRAPGADLLREAGRLAAQSSAPITDVRASAEYRRRLVTTLVARALARCLVRIEEARR
jgi:aerobic carbon-monoxide dehydrogenase medium subunit